MGDTNQKALPGIDGSGIIRVEKRDKWLTIENATVRDKRLSFGARGLLSYLLSHPNKWEIKVPHLIRQSPAGRDAVYGLLRELQKFRYLCRRKVHGNKGRIGWLSIIYETPQGEPLTDEQLAQLNGGRRRKQKGNEARRGTLPFTGFPDTDKPDTVEPDTVKPEVSSNNELLNDESSRDVLPKEELSPATARHASSSDQRLTDDDAALILRCYEQATGNRVREGDRTALREMEGCTVQLLKAGIALSVIRAYEAGTRINSLNYCRGAVEELRAPHVKPSYLEYVINKLELLPRT